MNGKDFLFDHSRERAPSERYGALGQLYFQHSDQIKQMNGTRTQMPQHVASGYKELVDGLKSMKEQQWRITNYAVLLLAAVFAVAAKGLNVPHLSSKLNFLIALTAVIGTVLLIKIQYEHGAITRAPRQDG